MKLILWTQWLYLADWNFIPIPFIHHLPLYFYVYALVLVLTMAVFLFLKIRGTAPRVSLSDICLSVTAVIFVLIIVLQTSGQQQYLMQLKKNYQGTTADAKRKRLFPYFYPFITYTQAQLKGHHFHGKILTDLKPNEALEPYMLQYYLYPQVDLIDEKRNPNCLVIFEKIDPEKQVPKNFKIIGYFDRYSLIAVR